MSALTKPFAKLVWYPRSTTGLFDFLAPWFPELPSVPAGLGANPAAWARGAVVVESSELEVARTLFTMTRIIGAQCVVEVGVYRGFTSEYFAAALESSKGLLHLVDLSEEALAAAMERTKRISITTQCHRGFSTDPAILAQITGPVDLIYLDADHSEQGIEADLRAWWPKLRPGGVIAIHDAVNIAGVCRVVNKWAEQYPCLTIATGRGSGLAMLRAPTSR